MTEKPLKVDTIPVPPPEFIKGLNHYEFKWDSLSITAHLENIDPDAKGELSVIHKNGQGDKLLLYKEINLLSILSCSQITKQLQKNSLQIEWDDILTHITHLTLADLRKGKPLAEIGNQPESMRTEYLLKPILIKNVPTTLFSSGGSGKSYLADYIALIVQNGVTGLNGQWLGIQGNVLYLDWESDAETHKKRVWAIKKGLLLSGDYNCDFEDTFKYQEMERPLIESVQFIQNLVTTNSTDLIIVDSHMAAQDNGLDQSQAAQRFYNALRSFHCTSLTIDHTSKEDWKNSNETVAPYGTVSKFNRSRAQFQLIKSQNVGDDYIECSLKHLKNNDGKLLRPIGLRIDFKNADENEDILEWVSFKPCTLTENPTLSRTLSQWEQIQQAIKSNNNIPMKPIDISKVTGLSNDIVSMNLNNYKDKYFVQVDKKDHRWGLYFNE